MTRRLALGLVSLVLLHCAQPMWLTRTEAPSYALPKRIPIVVTVSDRINATDQFGFVATLVETLESRLRDEGLEPRVIAAPDAKLPSPRVELVVRAQNEVSEQRGPFALECRVLSADEQQVFLGTLGGPFRPGGARAAARIVANLITEHAR